MAAALCCLLLFSIWGAAVCPAAEGFAGIRPSHAAAIIALLDTSGTLLRAQSEAREMVAHLRDDNPRITAEVWERLAGRISTRKALEQIYVPVYARYLPEDVARGVVSFYHTPVGARYLDANPRIQDESRRVAQACALQLAQEILAGPAGTNGPAALPAAANPDANRLSGVQELLQVSGTLITERQVMLDMLDRLQHGGQGDTVPTEFWEGARRRLGDEAQLMRLWVPAYVHWLSESDVQELIRFYRGPVGARFAAALPAIQHDSSAAAEQLGREAAQATIREVLGPLPQWRLSHPHGVAEGDGTAPIWTRESP
jgi:uncharacterized protein